jgi:trimeric autotransporter adhesin
MKSNASKSLYWLSRPLAVLYILFLGLLTSARSNPPVITINGFSPTTLYVGSAYVDPGASAVDDASTTIPVTIDASGVNANAVGSYNVIFTATSSGETSTATRTVNVVSSAVWSDNFQLPLGLGGEVRAIVHTPDAVYVGGSFLFAGNVRVNNILKVDKATGVLSPLGSASLNGMNGSVSTLALVGTDLFVGGSFTTASSETQNAMSANRIARWNTITGTWSPFGSPAQNGTGGSVRALAVMDHKLYVAGSFTTVSSSVQNATSAMNIALWDMPTATWSPLGSETKNGTNSTVSTIAVLGTDLYVGGSFTTATSATQTEISANRIARWDTTSATWSPLGSPSQNGTGGAIAALSILGNNIYAGGSFVTVSSATQTSLTSRSVARWDPVAATWSPLGGASQNGTNVNNVTALAIFGSDLYVGGGFSAVLDASGGISANNIARWNTTTSIWSRLGSASQNGTESGGSGGTVYSLALVGTDLYVGGNFVAVKSSSQKSLKVGEIAKWNISGALWSQVLPEFAFGDGINGRVDSVVDAGSVVYVGGSFSKVGNVTANNIACWSKITQTWSPLGSATQNGATGSGGPLGVRAMKLVGTDLYVAGYIKTVSSNTQPEISVNGIARWDTITGTWSPLGNPAQNGIGTGSVRALAVMNNSLYVAGSFTTVSSSTQYATPARNIARWDWTTATWSRLGSAALNGTNLSIESLAVIGTDLYVGGQISTVSSTSQNAIAVNRIARWDTTTESWSPLGSATQNGMNAPVTELAVIGTDLYVGGSYSTVSSSTQSAISVNQIARWDTTTGTWYPLGSATQNGVAGSVVVTALAVEGTNLYVGGTFRSVSSSTQNPISANRIARWNTTTSKWAPMGSAAQNGVATLEISAMLISGNDLYVGGRFENASGAEQELVPSQRFGIMHGATVTPQSTTPTVISPASTAITDTDATLSGNAIGDGGTDIIERGWVYSLTSAEPAPEIGNPNVTKVTATTNGAGPFYGAVTGLTAASRYSFRAYATNSVGTAYSSAATFTTLTAEIAIEHPAATSLTSGGSTIDFGTRPAGSNSAAKVFTIRNLGTFGLSLNAPTINGGNVGDFAIDNTDILLTVPPSGQTTFSVAFTPNGGGARTTTLTIGSNDTDEASFTIALSGTGLLLTNDTDNDGLNDVAEYNYATLGFDWQVAQPALVATLFAGANDATLFSAAQFNANRTAGQNDVINAPNTFSLYTLGQVQALNVDTPLLTRDSAGVFKLTIGLKKNTDLFNGTFLSFPFTALGTAVNGAGEIEFQFTSPENAAFFRVEAK